MMVPSPHSVSSQTTDHNNLLHLPATPTPRFPASTCVLLSVCYLDLITLPLNDLQYILQFEDNPLPTFILLRMVNGSRVNPRIKDLPPQIGNDFCNGFIQHIIKQVANSTLPWINLEPDALQLMYNVIYSAFPRQIQNSNTAHHPVSEPLSTILSHANIIADDHIAWGFPQPYRLCCSCCCSATSHQCLP